MAKSGRRRRVPESDLYIPVPREDGTVPLLPTKYPPPEENTLREWNEAQKETIRAYKDHDVIFTIGQPGTGKSSVLIWLAGQDILAGKLKKLVLVRPVCEAAGENLGFQKGDLAEKLQHYFYHLFDAIDDMFSKPKAEEIKKVTICRPLAFMRGTTLKNAAVVFDEAQNATTEQFKLFCSRMGFSTKYLINGDPSQVDKPQAHGVLVKVANRFSTINKIKTVWFRREHNMRNPLVTEMVDALDGIKDGPSG
jgi:phosphate starvation-inducible protein PhoH and related proteins